VSEKFYEEEFLAAHRQIAKPCSEALNKIADVLMDCIQQAETAPTVNHLKVKAAIAADEIKGVVTALFESLDIAKRMLRKAGGTEETINIMFTHCHQRATEAIKAVQARADKLHKERLN